MNVIVGTPKHGVSISKVKDIIEDALERDKIMFFNLEKHIKDIFIDCYERTKIEMRVLRNEQEEGEQMKKLGSSEEFSLIVRKIVLFSLFTIWKNLSRAFNNSNIESSVSYQNEWKKIEHYFMKIEMPRIVAVIDGQLGLSGLFIAEFLWHLDEKSLFSYPRFGAYHDDYHIIRMGIMDTKEIENFLKEEVNHER